MKWALLEDLLLVEDPSFFESFHFSSKYKGGAALPSAEAMESREIAKDFGVKTEQKQGKTEQNRAGRE